MAIVPGRRSVHRIRVGRLLDGTDREPLTDAALLVIDGTIAEVGKDAAVASPEDARTHAYPECTALPGLADAHVHVTLPPDRRAAHDDGRESDDELITRGAVAAERMVRAGITLATTAGRATPPRRASAAPSPEDEAWARDCWSAAGRSPSPGATATSSAARPRVSRRSRLRSAGSSRRRASTASRRSPPGVA
jgi:hypothetical protein